MANEYYITAGLPAIDYNDIGSVGTNAFYITAGLVANDYTPAAGGDPEGSLIGGKLLRGGLLTHGVLVRG